MQNTVILDKKNTIATITFNAAEKKNAFNIELARDFAHALDDATNDATIRAIVLRANGDIFMAGGDLKLFFANRDNMIGALKELSDYVIKITTLFENSNKPIVAAVHGAVAGIGFSFMLCADLVIAQQGTQLTTAYAHIGLTPDGGISYWLPRIVGTKKAAELLLLSEPFDAQKALELGLVNWVVPKDQFEQQIDTLMQKLAHGPTSVYAKIRTLLQKSCTDSFKEQVLAELEAFAQSTQTEDFQHGINGFINKKRPEFVGR
jgi:2-(1,2-epoxy-1,2-dihydrophenyl)acetyl-CoA isomerase